MDVDFINFLTCGCIQCALCMPANADPYAIFEILDYGLVNISVVLLLH